MRLELEGPSRIIKERVNNVFNRANPALLDREQRIGNHLITVTREFPEDKILGDEKVTFHARSSTDNSPVATRIVYIQAPETFAYDIYSIHGTVANKPAEVKTLEILGRPLRISVELQRGGIKESYVGDEITMLGDRERAAIELAFDLPLQIVDW